MSMIISGAAVIGSLFGVAGAGLSGFKMQKRVGDVEEFEIKPLRNVYCKYVNQLRNSIMKVVL
jgi:hypothetical protein